jgi:hypothetical protein
MKPESPVAGSYLVSEKWAYRPHPVYLRYILVLNPPPPYMPRSPTWSVSFGFIDSNSVNISHLSHVFCMSSQSEWRTILFGNLTIIRKSLELNGWKTANIGTGKFSAPQIFSEIWVCHSDEDVDCCVVGYDALLSYRWLPTFRRIVLLPSSGFEIDHKTWTTAEAHQNLGRLLLHVDKEFHKQ